MFNAANIEGVADDSCTYVDQPGFDDTLLLISRPKYIWVVNVIEMQLNIGPYVFYYTRLYYLICWLQSNYSHDFKVPSTKGKKINYFVYVVSGFFTTNVYVVESCISNTWQSTPNESLDR